MNSPVFGMRPGAHVGLAGTLALPPRRAFAPTAGERLVLADGRSVQLRPVQPGDVAAEQAFVTALSPASRRRRFHGAMKQLPASVLQAMTSIDFRRHVALVAEAGCADGAARLVADARYVRDEHGGAEFALAVADDWQGLGLGRALLQRLGRHARLSGVRTLNGSVLADNAPMLALMRSLGAQLRDDPSDATLVQVAVAL
ncbi:MAG: GNAT family N-acetyltransferase [Burkholderiales bacterium]|nr:GNAT family N-acetyltransferase [Burkholderiales bacterium]